ncbi:hypothetical protein [Kitasatospora griseola]|uniref:hypothetical protein n=1 Tax=Kitasatospora griseola TaxID=2064 RepID=UPI00364D1271
MRCTDHPDHPDRHAQRLALAAAAHSAGHGPGPATAPALAARLRATAAFADRAEHLDGPDEAAPLLGPAVEFAEACLRHDPWPLSVPGCARASLARLCPCGVSPARSPLLGSSGRGS